MAIEFSQLAQAVGSATSLQTPNSSGAQNNNIGVSPTAAQEAVEAAGQAAQAAVVEGANVSEINADSNVTETQVADAIESIQSFVDSNQRNLSFSVDEDSQRSVVSVTDASSGDVIRQIPSEEVLELAQRLQELQVDFGSASGIFFNREV
jgi:flagellar protein FlaG